MKGLVILSHKLTDEQVEELQIRFNVKEILYLPDELQRIWSNIDPLGELPIEKLQKILDWIEGEKGEEIVVIAQGDFGATCYIVDYCFKKGYKALYATSKRQVKEEIVNGEVITTRVFKHVNFRLYRSWEVKN
ncbi:hypothetical protein SAMN02745227_01781 [Anaerobranca californiensis DSM 14826]|uniref:CRISPR-associated protein n=1 Tax=Anaerobranca californiensis DSM 14826 TaxID=1120989 RepID=A0A1M6QK63_9FIRM|nr:CRISPR-associated protein Csx20 [Anaerobranca californiensis]SHK20632.1 hypothetical protein SAMN02745227_01781 [Anaerobranca californiensis DSM 14826]